MRPARDAQPMTATRIVVVGLGLAAGAALARRHLSEMDFGKVIEGMPDDAPPKWMFRNISAIRANTERILELMEHAPSAPERG